jgi:hypothetical protein
LSIFLGFGGIILSVFLGIATGAERPGADPGKDYSDNSPVHLRALKGGDYPFYHLSSVGVQLVGIIKDDPGAKQTVYRLPGGGINDRPFLVYGTGGFSPEVFLPP